MEKTKGHQALSKAVVKQTAASEFDRLHTALDKAGLPIYDVIDDKPANLSIARKEIIEVDARLRVSGMETVRELFGLFSKVAMPASRTSSTGTSPNG